MTATTTASSGSTVNFRASPGGRIILQIPVNKTVTVEQKGEDWSTVTYSGRTGYVMTKFLLFGDSGDTITVSRAKLERIYDELGQILHG